jgi:hypothetical protein
MLLVDAAGGTSPNALAEVIVAVGGAISAIIGAVALFGRRRTAEAVAALPVEFPDPEDRPARLRERLSALETTREAHGELLEHHGEEIALLRAGQLTAEGIDRLARSIAAQLGPQRPARRS